MSDDRPAIVADPPPIATPKRSFFGKSSFTKPKTTEASDDVDLFRRSERVFGSTTADRERKVRQQAEKDARRRSRERRRALATDHDHVQKKRRISSEHEGGIFAAVETEKIVSPSANTPSGSTPARQTTSPTLAQVHNRLAETDGKSKRVEVITVDSDSEPDPEGFDELYDAPRRNVQQAKKPGPSEVVNLGEDEAEDSDPEIQELINKAKAKRRQKDLDRQARLQCGGSAPSQQPPRATVEVLITTDIDGVRPLLVKAFLDHRIKELREAFRETYRRQVGEMSAELASQIIFTWRGEKQFEYRSLGVMLKSGADITVGQDGTLRRSSLQIEGLTPDLDQVHIEAITQEAYDAAQKLEQATKPPREPGGAHEQAAQPGPPEEKKDLIKIVLREGKEYGDLKLKIRAADTARKLANAFSIAKGVPSDKRLVLMFDGEELAPDVSFEDSELQPDDIIEVYVR